MDSTFYLHSINQVHQSLGLASPKHPLVSVVRTRDYQTVEGFKGQKVAAHLYQIVFKDKGCGTVHYGQNAYDYEEGTLLFLSPGQVVEYEENYEPNGDNSEEWALVFHPDLIRKSDLANKMDHYTFFHYAVSEALHLSQEERTTIEELLDKIIKEYSQNLDRHSQHLILSNIQLLLDYCLRFYDRQFYTRTNLNRDLLSKFERLLSDYYQSERVGELGIPTVSYCAKELHLSPNYLSDLLKKETGKTAQEHIHLFVIERAKNHLLNSAQAVSEIGFSLGFEYPQHFSSLFKSKTGLSPRQYRKTHLN